MQELKKQEKVNEEEQAVSKELKMILFNKDDKQERIIEGVEPLAMDAGNIMEVIMKAIRIWMMKT